MEECNEDKRQRKWKNARIIQIKNRVNDLKTREKKEEAKIEIEQRMKERK